MKTDRFCAQMLALCLAAGLVTARENDEDPLDRPADRPDEPVVIQDWQPDSGAPQIVIRPGRDKVIYEYRENGRIVEIKVDPEIGPPYYLVPAEGGGWIREESSGLLIPSWVIFSW